MSTLLPHLHDEIGRAQHELDALRHNLSRPGADTAALLTEINAREQTLAGARNVAERFVEGSENFPKPREISELGRPDGLSPGESRDHQWLGKNVLTGIDEKTGLYVSWKGEKTL